MNRIGICTSITLLFVARVAWGQVQYTVTDLGTLPGGTSSYAYSINNLGQVVGEASTSATTQHAFLYSGGSLTDLGSFGQQNSYATGINDKGQIVGYVISVVRGTTTYQHGFLYSNGTSQILGSLPGGSYSTALGINNSGQIVGYADIGNDHHEAFLYSGGSMTNLVPGGPSRIFTKTTGNPIIAIPFNKRKARESNPHPDRREPR